ncbi:MAG: hypothetical protein IKQ60_06250 [Candidatus Methanomethylophilaceae archaeon]|nr:hypothetical protein [Candidatus Methanomethylophilaceae archaeon]
MKPISLESVCRVVYDRNEARIRRQKEFKAPALPYSREDFTKDVLSGGFILSPTTVKAKWKALEATGVVVRGGYSTALNIKALEQMAEACE